jgi:DNA-binding NtrC family response regulator
MGGIEVIQAAQARWPRLPAILVTGYVSAAAALPTGGAQYALLRKPLAVDQLADIIAILLAGRSNVGSSPAPPHGAVVEHAHEGRSNEASRIGVA